jgi:hypothetical protein
MNEDGRRSGLPVLPLFSASHLGACYYFLIPLARL